MANRKRTSAQRTQSKLRKVLQHQQQIDRDGLLPVYAMTLEQHFDDGVLFPTQVYKAPLQSIIEGYPRNSQTAVVMLALEKYGAENARL